jgi:hypothetical protein
MASSPVPPRPRQPVVSRSAGKTTRPAGAYARVEIRFEIPGVQGNPFDFTANDIVAAIRQPDGSSRKIPAFFDGGMTWRVRFTPAQVGRHAITGVTRNGNAIHPIRLSRSAFVVSGVPTPGFVRRDRNDPHRFVRDNGSGYYPIGNNVAWDTITSADTVEMMLAKMGRAGENWARIWMDHWDGKNLDWVEHKSIPFGSLDLGVARRWDAVVSSAEKSGVLFQLVLQHHGPYTTGTDSNWADNPWNVANGGFLSKPEEFFTSARAIALTKAKYRYIIARWGYSPSLMAWELFNEVQWTDAARSGDPKVVAAWHDDMAAFLRQHDPYKHLVTSSFSMDPKILGNRLDYWQPHVYTSDPLSAVSRLNGLPPDRPAFFGEIGPGGSASVDVTSFLRRALWGSLMSESSGAAQFWDWHIVDVNNLFPIFRSAAAFATWSSLAEMHGLKAVAATVKTDDRGPLSFGPGGEWEAAKQTDFIAPPSGDVRGLAEMPRFLQGDAHRALFPYAAFHVQYAKPGTFSVRIGQVAKAGARIVLSLDGAPLSTRDFPAGDKDMDVDAGVEIPVPAGRHDIRLDNTGKDWVCLKSITLDPYAYRLGVAGKANRACAVLWVYNRTDTPVSGTLKVPGLERGGCTVRWWDTEAGRPLRKNRVFVAEDGALSIATPQVLRDVAVVITREAGN